MMLFIQNILIPNNKINALSIKDETEKLKKEIEIKENNLSDKNSLNLPNIPSFTLFLLRR